MGEEDERGRELCFSVIPGDGKDETELRAVSNSLCLTACGRVSERVER